MYEADPRSKPRTNSRLSSVGCHAASGKTRFGKNRVVSAEIWVTRASTPNRVSSIRWDCSRHTRSSTNPREWRYSWRRTYFLFQAEDGIRDLTVTGVQTCALPI